LETALLFNKTSFIEGENAKIPWTLVKINEIYENATLLTPAGKTMADQVVQ